MFPQKIAWRCLRASCTTVEVSTSPWSAVAFMRAMLCGVLHKGSMIAGCFSILNELTKGSFCNDGEHATVGCVHVCGEEMHPPVMTVGHVA